MFEAVEAVSFVRRAGGGRTKPMLIECLAMDHDGNEIQVVAKTSGGCDYGEKDLVSEAYSSFLAADLELLCPPPHLVHMSDEFVDTITDSEIKSMVRRSNRQAFGCTYLRGFNEVPRPHKVRSKMLTQAAEVFAFDFLIGNPDRGVPSVNLLTNSDAYALIDHELAFSNIKIVSLAPIPVNPWEDGYEEMVRPRQHIFYPSCHSKFGEIDLSEMQRKLERISEERVESYRSAIPSAWNKEDFANKVRDYIQNLIGNAPQAISNAKRALS